jgi:head-tail adaptor
MRGGTLDRMIAIQRVTVTQSPSGEERETWATLSTRPAKYEPLPGEERFISQQYVAKGQVAFTVRWSTAIADLSPLDRIIYPASALANSPTEPLNNKIYEIMAVQEIGLHEALRILTAVRQDAQN